jgi:hypothetical protein
VLRPFGKSEARDRSGQKDFASGHSERAGRGDVLAGVG